MAHSKKEKNNSPSESARIKWDLLKENTVVILGKYEEGEHKDFLDNIATIISTRGYTPILLEEMYEVKKGTPRQAIYNIISSCNFVIADDSEASGETLELEYCRNCGATTAIISRFYNDNWQRSTFMTADFEIHSLDFKIFKINCDVNNMTELEKHVTSIINWKIKRKKEIVEKIQKKHDEYERAVGKKKHQKK